MAFTGKPTNANELILWNGTEFLSSKLTGDNINNTAVVTRISTSTILSAKQQIVLVDVSGGIVTVTMPASPVDGGLIIVKNDVGDASVNNITVSANVGHTIEDPNSMGTFSSSVVMNVKSGAVVWIYDATLTQWTISSFAYSAGSAITWTNDLAGSNNTHQWVAAISGSGGGGGTVPLNITTLSFGSTQSSPLINQADKTTNGGVGNSLTIQAQNETGTTSTGGNLILQSGTGTSIDGYIALEIGETERLVVNASGVVQINNLSTGVVHSDSSGNLTSSTIVNADIANAAAIAVSKLAAGTSGQILQNNGTPTPTWTTVSGDISITNAGVVTVTALQGNAVEPGGLGSTQDGYVLTWINSAGQWQPHSVSSESVSLAGDVTGTTSANTVVSISGPSPILITPATLEWTSGTSSPTLTQVAQSASGSPSTGQTLTITAQAGQAGTGTNIVGANGGVMAIAAGAGGASTGTAANSNGGNLTISSGAAGTGGSGTAGSAGNVLINTNGTTHLSIAPSGVTTGTTTDANSIVGSLKFTTRTASSSFTVDNTTTDMIIYADTSGGSFNVTLPTPTNGRTLIIKDSKQSFGAHNLTIVRHASEKIDGVTASLVLSTNNQKVILTSDGTDWYTNLFASSTTGTAGGDLNGTYPNPFVSSLSGSGGTGNLTTINTAFMEWSATTSAAVLSVQTTSSTGSGELIIRARDTISAGQNGADLNLCSGFGGAAVGSVRIQTGASAGSSPSLGTSNDQVVVSTASVALTPANLNWTGGTGNLQASGTTVISISSTTATVTGGLTQSGGAVSLTGNAASSFSTTSTHSLTLTAGASSTWSTSAGALTITSAAAATWSTAAGALAVDAATQLNLGTVNATAVNVANTGVTTTVNGLLIVTQGTTLNGSATINNSLTQSGGAVSLHSNAAADYTTSSGALTLTAAAASTWSTSAGALSLSGSGGTNIQTNGTTIASTDTNKLYAQKGWRQNVTPVTNSSSPYTILATDNIIAADPVGGTITLNLPTSPTVGDTYAVKDVSGNSGFNPITVDSGTNNVIDASETFALDVNYGSITLVCTSTTFNTSHNRWSLT